MEPTGANTSSQTSEGAPLAGPVPPSPPQPPFDHQSDRLADRLRERALDGLAYTIARIMDLIDTTCAQMRRLGNGHAPIPSRHFGRAAFGVVAGACAVFTLTAFLDIDQASPRGKASAMSAFGGTPDAPIVPASLTVPPAADAPMAQGDATMSQEEQPLDEPAYGPAPIGDDEADAAPTAERAIAARRALPVYAAMIAGRADPMVDAEEEMGANPPVTIAVAMENGDTLGAVFDRVGLGARQSHAAVQAMRTVHDPRKLRPGQELTVTVIPPRRAEDPALLTALSFEPEPGTTVTIARADKGQFASDKVKAQLVKSLRRVDGKIESSLYLAAVRAGLPSDVLADMIRTFSYDVDFQRDIQPNDTFEVMFESYATEAGRPMKNGNVLFATMTIGGKPMPLYRFTDRDGFVDYYDEKGRSVRKALLRTPINGARLSSTFGNRRHPILGYNKMHKGVDFAAPIGTPIYAAGHGIVEQAGWNGGYGKYVRVRHQNGYSTAYAHMTGIAGGIKAGARVRQGQVIGYLGSTGRSTGPHLHYEVLTNGKQMNPLSVRLPSGQQLAGKDLSQFQALRDGVERQLAALRDGKPIKVASAE